MAAQHRFAFEVRGDAEALNWWPDEGLTLLAADEAPSATATLAIDNADDAWQVGAFKDDAERELCTSVFLTTDEEKSIDISSILVDRRHRIEPIVEAIAEQIRASNDDLDAHLTRILDAKRVEFEDREGVSRSLDLPYEWFAKAPALITAPPASENPPPSTSQEPSEEKEPSALMTPFTSRLDPKSFEQIQRIIRMWADSVERYQRSFSELSEDQLSDLLAATLNASTSGAGREVFTSSGKSDIFVRAGALQEGSGPANVLIIESKWARGKKVVQEALDPQLFGYLTVRDTSAVLLVLIGEKFFTRKRTNVLKSLREVDGFTGESVSAVSDWPVFVYKKDGREVSVCIATVHVQRAHR